MITFTNEAREVILSLVGQVEDSCLRLAVGGSPLAPDFDFSLVEAGSRVDGDEILDAGGFRVLVDADSIPRVSGLTVDWVERDGLTGFELRPAPAPPGERPTGPLADRVQKVLDERVNPGIAAHGGEILLRDVKDDVVYIEMSGGCQGCAMSRMTLKQGVERMLKEEVPEVRDVQDVTDHASGSNPYFT